MMNILQILTPLSRFVGPRKKSKAHRAAEGGYGLMLLLVFLTSTVLIGTSLQLLLGPAASGYLGSLSQDNASAQQAANLGMETVLADIQADLSSNQTVDTSYTYSSSSSGTNITTPNDPTSLGGSSTTIATYTATMTAARGSSYLVKVVATVGNASYAVSRLVNITRTSPSSNTIDTLSGGNANAMYSMRKLRSAYAGSAIRVRRSSDDTEQDIGFDANGNLDMSALNTFISSSTLPLDSVGSAATAYGLRRLKATYRGYCLKVRRSSDSTTLDIGFMPNGDLDVPTLMNFVGSGTGYVTTWYDQSGNSNNAAQATTTKQPTIMVSGVLNMINNRPAIKYDGTDDYLSFTRNISDDFSILAVYNVVSADNPYYSATGPTTYDTWNQHSGIVDGEVVGVVNDFGIAVDSNGYTYVGVGNPDTTILSTGNSGVNSIPPPGINDSQWHWVAMRRTKSTGFFTGYHDMLKYNGPDSNTPNTSSLTAATNLTIGAIQTGAHYLNGSVSEVILYASNISTANLKTLEYNESWYYNMQDHTWTGWNYPLSNVTGATAAYGLRRLRGGYSGNLIKVRRSSDNTTQDISYDGCCNLDVKSLLSFVGSGDGFIDTWYDQSGNGYNLTQATTAQQPQIVSSGSLYMLKGEPMIYFNGSNTQYLTNTGLAANTSTTASAIVLAAQNTSSFYSRLMSIWNTSATQDWNNDASASIIQTETGYIESERNSGSNGRVTANVGFASLYPFVAAAIFDGANETLYLDGGKVASHAYTAAFNYSNIRLGCSLACSSSNDKYTGYMSEAYLYPTALSATQRVWLIQQVEWYHANPLPALFVTKWYDQSGNGYDAVQYSPWLQPNLVMPRYGPMNNRPAINFDGAAYLYTTGGMPTSSNYTISEVFSYYDSTADNNMFSDAAGNIHALYMHNSNYLRLYHAGLFVTAAQALSTNQNYAIAATFVQSTKGGTLYVFNKSTGTGTTANSNTNAAIQMGAHGGGVNNSMKGTISEAMVFSRVLSTADRTALYNDQRGYYAAQ